MGRKRVERSTQIAAEIGIFTDDRRAQHMIEAGGGGILPKLVSY